MAARPRTHNLKVPNLYQKLDKRTGRINFQYKDKRSGKFHGLGADPQRAIAVAKELNSRIDEQLVDHYSHLLNNNPTHVKEHGITLKAFADRFIAKQQKRHEDGDLSIHTLRQKTASINVLVNHCKNVGLKDIDVRSIAAILETYVEQGKNAKANQLRSFWSDMFKEAQHLGEVPPGFNPAEATRPQKVKVTRSRLSADEFKEILAKSLEISPSYINRALMLALTTGLRREDIANLKFKDVRDGYLHVATSKSNGKVKLAFPMELKNPLLDHSLGELISMCKKTRVVSQYIIHQSDRIINAKIGAPANSESLTKWFRNARNATSLTWEKGSTPPSFHEIRSLAERTYHEAGFDTQVLLGHKSRKMTDKYHDLRGSDYTYIQIAK